MSKTSNYKMTAVCGRPFPDALAFARHATAILGDMAGKLKTPGDNIPLSRVPELLRASKKRENYPDEQSFLSDQTFSAITFEKNIGVEDVSYAQRSGEDTCFVTANGDGETYDKQRYEIIRYLFSDPSFISAFKHNSSYYWDQNNRSFRHTDEDYNIPLCTKNGGLYYRADPYPDWPIIASGTPMPTPLNQEYDISKNPGYFEFHQTYLEEISATMWLGKEFCPRTGADREAVKAADWLQTEEMEYGILKVVAWDHPFDSDEEPQRSVQFNLRKLLYPKAILERKQKEIDRKKITANLLQDYYENGSPPVGSNQYTVEIELERCLPDESYKEALKSDKFRKPDGTPDFAAIVEKYYSIRHQDKGVC